MLKIYTIKLCPWLKVYLGEYKDLVYVNYTAIKYKI